MGMAFSSIKSPISSQETEDGSFMPSTFTLYMATESKSKYKGLNPTEKYEGDKKILVIASDDGRMKMKNGKVFNTGNHPIETFLPLLHLRDHGFSFDIATTGGKPVVLEMWAYPQKDDAVKAIHEENRAQLESPHKISDIANLDDYVAVFLPGGHGAMINLPTNA